MNTIKVEGKNRNNHVLLFTLTLWKRCKMTKEYLIEHDIAFEYVDVVTVSEEDRREIFDTLVSMTIPVGFPVSIIDDTVVMSGYHPDELKDALKIANA